MTGTSAPFGLKPIYHPSGQCRPRKLDGGIASGYSSNIFLGDPVKVTAGAGTIAVSTGSDSIVGSFAGCEYTDTFGRTHEIPMWSASTVIQTGTTVRAWFHEDPATIYSIQASGSLAQTSVGNQANTTNYSAGNTTTGISAVQISTTLAGSGSSAQLRILDLFPDIANTWGDTYTIVMVNIAKHQWLSAANAI